MKSKRLFNACLTFTHYVKPISVQLEFDGILIKRQFSNYYSVFWAVTVHNHEGKYSLQPFVACFYGIFLEIIIFGIS